MHKKRNIIIALIAAVLIILGGVSLMQKPMENHLAKSNQVAAINRTKKLTSKQVHKNLQKPGNFNYASVKPINSQQVKAASKQNIVGIGLISIPSVNLHLPILKGLASNNLATGACTMRNDQIMGQGNYPLAGHYMTQSGNLFSPIENTQIGDYIYLTDLSKIYTYKIYLKKVVTPQSVYLINDTPKNIVTLITCANGGSDRWCVRGNLIHTEKYHQNNNIF